jgi:hypothetical protein
MSSPQALSVQASLTLLSHNCALSIAALNPKPDAPELPLSSLRTDFISLLSLIYSNTTKLSIALNPSNPTYSAALIPLKDLITHSATLASNASSFLPNVHGRALIAEVHSTAKGVLTALQELAHAHLFLLANPTSKDVAVTASSKDTQGTYLAKTAIVHELITRAKAEDHPQGISRTELIAVRKRWREHSEIIADAAATLEIEVSLPDGDDDGDDFDDGWDDPDLGLIVPGKLSLEQVELAKTVRIRYSHLPHPASDWWRLFPLREHRCQILNVVERTSALINDILGALLPLRAAAQPLPNALLDHLLDSAPPLVAAVDELATHIYDSPDDPSQLGEARNSFARALVSMTSAVKAFWKGKEDTRSASEKGSRAYFIEQFAQLNVAVETVQWTALT